MAQKRVLPDVLTAEEQIKFLRVFDQRYINGRKNRLIVELLMTIGLRASELCNLEWNHVNLKDGKIRVIQGKNDKDRNLGIPLNLAERLADYKKEAPKSAHVFATRTGKPLDRRNLYEMVKKYLKKATGRENGYTHLLRHTALTDAYDSSNNIRLVQEMAGHADISTTMIYTHINPKKVLEHTQKSKY